MNKSMIRYILGWVLVIESALMLLPLLVALIYGERSGLWFLAVIGVAALAGFLLSFKKPKDTVFYLKEGCVATALSWLVMSIFGALPFCLSGFIPRFTDALFETVSGFTTTGASILTDVEALPNCMLFWRSFTHWIGGMGVLVFLLAIITMTGGSHMNLMKAESPGPSVGKLVPKVKSTARILYYIYIGMTLLQILLMVLGGATLFEASTITFGTAGTGGFGIYNDSIASFSPYLQWVVTIFMILFGVNFNAYYLLLLRRWKDSFMEEIRWYLAIITAAVAIITLNAFDVGMTFFQNLRHAAFQVASLITTTGFSTLDFDLWPTLSKSILVLLMFIGACAGSTGGGIKVSRIAIGIKTVKNEIASYIHPKSVRKVRLDGKLVDDGTQKAVMAYFLTFLIIFVTSVLTVSIDGYSFTTNFTAVAATINNIGPGLDLVGPSRNFAFYSDLSKYVMIFDMLAGRLELFPMLILFHPAIWKDILKKQDKKA